MNQFYCVSEFVSASHSVDSLSGTDAGKRYTEQVRSGMPGSNQPPANTFFCPFNETFCIPTHCDLSLCRYCHHSYSGLSPSTGPESKLLSFFSCHTMAEIEKLAIIETLTLCQGHRANAARHLGISEKTIYNKIKQYRLQGQV